MLKNTNIIYIISTHSNLYFWEMPKKSNWQNFGQKKFVQRAAPCLLTIDLYVIFSLNMFDLYLKTIFF